MGVSQKDIAKMLGVTRVTVTRALGDSPLVSTEMKARVRALCEEVGYHPHYSSRSLKSAETRVISVMRFDMRLTDLHSRWVSYLQEEARRAGYMVRLDQAHNFDRICGEGSADGFIVFNDHWSYVGQPELMARAEDGSTPLVVIDCRADSISNGVVSTDNLGGATLAARHLTKLGHRKIAYLGLAAWGVGEERYSAFQREMLVHGLPVGGLLCVGASRWAEDIDDVFALENGLKIALTAGATAIFAASDLYAAGVVTMLYGLGLSVPGDVSVIGYDDSLLSRAYHPSLTTIRQDVATASRVAVEMLLARIHTSDATRTRATVPAILVARESTAPPHGACREALQG